MTTEDIKRNDPIGMYSWILNFPSQIEEALRIGKSATIKLNTKGIRNIVLTGLGGSAIGGDLLRSYLQRELAIPFIVNRHYVLPDFVDRNTLVVVSSYSGNTEETISAHKDAIRRKAKILCISTGGETARIAKKLKQPWIKIPSGFSPRAALGYSFIPLLTTFSSLKLVRNKDGEIREAVRLLKPKSATFGNVSLEDNPPLRLAERIQGKVPIVYSATDHYDAVNLRWRGQIAENAKQLAFGHVLPEMNHNELVGWNRLPELMKQSYVIFLRDRRTHPRVAIREEITKQVISQYAGGVSEVWSEGRSLLARMLYLVHFGDWVSYYLAILNGEDPTPVKVIDYLKGELAKV
ncbi:MAG TPA: bifunctional phosphoglucose/phosphomannose isomerase [Bacteroidota bacterium]|nr:bifunctional phosphoglucose/phosphomannose isomerase [Bacteroidota bacterium]